MHEPTNMPMGEARVRLEKKRILYTRLGIQFVAIVAGLVSVLSIVGFVFNMFINERTTGRPVIAVGPVWMLGHVIRGLGLGALTFQMLRYQSALKHWRPSDGEGLERLLAAQSAAWITGAVVLGAMAIYAIAYVAGGSALH